MPDHYDPQKQRRRSIRLRDYDYTQPGACFVTIVNWRRQTILGQIQAGEVRLSLAGEIVQQVWENLPRHFKNVTLGNAVIMPNHFHGIIFINGRGEASAGMNLTSPSTHVADASPLRSPKGTTTGSLGAIVQNFEASAGMNLTSPSIHRGDASPLRGPKGTTTGSLGVTFSWSESLYSCLRASMGSS
jgi:hypothetical protein